MRLLRCVWRGTKKPAGQSCNQTKRPIAIRACLFKRKLPECGINKNEGREEGRCFLVNLEKEKNLFKKFSIYFPKDLLLNSSINFLQL